MKGVYHSACKHLILLVYVATIATALLALQIVELVQ